LGTTIFQLNSENHPKPIPMKSLLKKIAFFLNYLRNFRTINKFKSINTKLQTTIEEREVDRIILKGQIIKMVRKYLNIGAKSDFIPITNRNRTEIRERVLAEFGEQMNKLGIRINAKLELV
jgi:protoheme ferro-lyase